MRAAATRAAAVINPAAMPKTPEKPVVREIIKVAEVQAEGKNEGGIFDVIGLLTYLKGLTGELPDTKRNSFLRGKYPETLDSVIDRLRKLAIIKVSAKSETEKGR